MSDFIKRRSKKSMHPPESLIYVGDEKQQDTKITVIDFDETNYDTYELKPKDLLNFQKKYNVCWINIDGLQDKTIFENIGSLFSIHTLTLEDILNTDQRPKMEEHENYFYFVMKMLNKNNAMIDAEQISIILGKDHIISFQERTGDIFDHIRQKIKNSKGKIRKMGQDYLFYNLIDSIVDNYFIILEKLGDDIEYLEDLVIDDPRPEVLNSIYKIKKEAIYLRKYIWPLREVLNQILREDRFIEDKALYLYFKDIYDHTIQILDTIETFRDIISGLIDIYLSSISNKMNQIMKVLTIIATIFIPLTFIAGVYGMNFEFMPELHFKWSYPLILFIMFLIGVSMMFYFKRKKWF